MPGGESAVLVGSSRIAKSQSVGRHRDFRACTGAVLGLAVVCVWTLLLVAGASAADFTWTGASTQSQNWADPLNWGGTAPSGSVGLLDFPRLTSAACEAEPALAACYRTENDISGLAIDALAIDGPYTINDSLSSSPPGDGITLGAGGLTVQDEGGAGSLEGINVPIELGATQTWSFDGPGYIPGTISGDHELALDVSGAGIVSFNGGAEVGPVAVRGASEADTGEAAGQNGTVWVGTPDPAADLVPDMNGTNRNPVTVSNAALGSNEGKTGPLTVRGGDIVFGLASKGASLTVEGGVQLDEASALEAFVLHQSNGEDLSTQLDASGAVALGEARLHLSKGFGSCELPLGHVYTLVASTGRLEGTFKELPDGSTVALPECGAPHPVLRINYTAHSVTATTVGPSFTWSGGGGASVITWSTGANWLGGTAPVSGESIDTLAFPRLAGANGSENDLSGLNVESLQLDDSRGIDVTGNGITLGARGLTLSAEDEPPIGAAVIAAPLALSSSQTWSVSAPASPNVPNPPMDDLSLEGRLTGETANLTINLDTLSALAFGDLFSASTGPDDEIGDVTINGNSTVIHVGEIEEIFRSFVDLPAGLDGADGKSLTVNGVDLGGNGPTGPIVAKSAEVGLSGTGIGAISASASSVDLDGQVASLHLDAQSSLNPLIDAAGATPGSDYDQMTSSGPIELDGASLALESFQTSEKTCPPPPVGQVYTLISTAGSLVGTFGNAPDGSTLTAECIATAGGVPIVERVYSYRVDYNTGELTKTVTATALPAVPVSYSGAPPTISGVAQPGQMLSVSHAFWANSPTSYSDQWQRCDAFGQNCQAIAGATGQTYLLTAVDGGSTMRVQETAFNSEGRGTPADSEATPVVASGEASPGSSEGHSSSNALGASLPPTTMTLPEPAVPPVAGRTERVSVVAGTVSVRLTGTHRFVSLSSPSAIPDGSEFEATHGRVLITVATLTPGQTQTAEVYGGRFLVHQQRGGTGETHLTLSLPLAGCPRARLPRGPAAALAASVKRRSGAKSRHLWVSEGGGSWGTNGRYVSTSVERTRWLTIDECERSQVDVAAGKVRVRDLVKNRTKIVSAGGVYVAVASTRAGA